MSCHVTFLTSISDFSKKKWHKINEHSGSPSLSLWVTLSGSFLPFCLPFSIPEGVSIRQQLRLSVVVKRHFNLAALPGVQANYHFKGAQVAPGGVGLVCFLPLSSLCLSLRLLSNSDEGPAPRACPSLLAKLNFVQEWWLAHFTAPSNRFKSFIGWM